jgi:hypothetical protein
MGTPPAPTADGRVTPLLLWVDVGPPPAAVRAWSLHRLAGLRRYGAAGGALVVGGIVGYVATIVWPGSPPWPSALWIEAFLGVGVPVAVADWFWSRWLFGFLFAHAVLDVRRLAIAAGTVHVEQTKGAVLEIPARRLGVSVAPVAADWHQVSWAAGRVTLSFFVPARVAAQLRGAQTGTA